MKRVILIKVRLRIETDPKSSLVFKNCTKKYRKIDPIQKFYKNKK